MKVIAEICSNVKNLKDCFKSIDMAAEAGADYVKFQYFTDRDMYGMNLGYKPILNLDEIPQLSKYARNMGIGFSCTFFNPETLRANSQYIDFIKIASSDMLYEDLLKQAKDLHKLILLSTGGHTEEQVEKALTWIDNRRLVLMYCESAYPAKRTDLDKLEVLKIFTKKIGVSDHSLDVYQTPILARDLGVLYFEKHVNFLDYTDTPDAPHSLSHKEFQDMMSKLKGKKRLNLLSPDEMPMVSMYNRRCVATKKITAGEKLIYGENFGYYRSLKPETEGFRLTSYLKGKVAKREILQGQTITGRYI